MEQIKENLIILDCTTKPSESVADSLLGEQSSTDCNCKVWFGIDIFHTYFFLRNAQSKDFKVSTWQHGISDKRWGASDWSYFFPSQSLSLIKTILNKCTNTLWQVQNNLLFFTIYLTNYFCYSFLIKPTVISPIPCSCISRFTAKFTRKQKEPVLRSYPVSLNKLPESVLQIVTEQTGSYFYKGTIYFGNAFSILANGQFFKVTDEES